MYNFLLNMWIMNRIDEAFLEIRVSKGQIKEEEKNMIIATPRVPKY